MRTLFLFLYLGISFLYAADQSNNSPYFQVNLEIKSRCDQLVKTIGLKLVEETKQILERQNRQQPQSDNGWVLLKEDVELLKEKYHLQDTEELMRLLVPLAGRLATMPISNYRVGAVGLEKETGSLILGGNLEFPGSPLSSTVHAEQFVFTRSFQRGTTVETIALDEANACGHCRQFMSEFSGRDKLRLVDMKGHEVKLADLYPWSFDPSALGEQGLVTKKAKFSDLSFDEALKKAVDISYAPYSKAKASVVVEVKSGKIFVGSYIENVAFNPSLGPLQAAVVRLVANGFSLSDVRRVALGQTKNAVIDFEPEVKLILKHSAPEAEVLSFWF
ncbi:MAG: cytidine deaminase [Bacteriovoracia bacterium]